jgi:nitrite reductase/ring-hydroxylating ferredoxin subunit/uncharacterized membrane protein
MKSRAHIQSHPIHPMLVGFPIAFFVGAFLFDLVSLLMDKPSLQVTAGYLAIAGIASGLAAAIPGIIDYTYTVPPDSSAKKRATKHGLLNTTVLLIFGCVLWMKAEEADLRLILGTELIGLILLTAAGWLGGTLVYRNQIGVDVRYADAGKWKEDTLQGSGGKVYVADINELEISQMKLLHINGQRVVLGRTDKGYVAFEDRCPHKGGALSGGALVCGTVQCPWHGSQFDVTTGALKAGPAEKSIKTYKLTEESGKIYLDLSAGHA